VKIAITGSSGFVGSNFIKSEKGIDITEVDLLKVRPSEIDFRGMDSILHLAALVHQMKGARDAEYFVINRDLSYEVAKLAKSHGVKQFVLMSTSKVYGEETVNGFSWNEQTDCFPIDPYGQGKLEAEKLIQKLEDEYFKVAIIRSPLVYGPGVKANMFNLIRLIDKFPLLPFKDTGNRRSFVYVGNLTALIKQIIIDNETGVFIAGDPEPISTTKLTNLIANSLETNIILIKIPQFLLRVLSLFIPEIISRLYRSLELDSSNTNEKLQFYPPYTTAEGIEETVKWYKDCKNNRL
jgi:nucleoside-diphosphate-sugar epimerase